MSKGQLTQDDWIEVAAAVDHYKRAIAGGNLGPEFQRGEDRRWIAHLEAIQEAIGPDGEDMLEERDYPALIKAVLHETETGSTEKAIDMLAGAGIPADKKDPLDHIDWPLLRQQKGVLVGTLLSASKTDPSPLETAIAGIVHLLDSLQDYAVDVMGVTEDTVFEPAHEDTEEPAAPTPGSVFIVILEGPQGTTSHAFSTEEKADQWLFDHIKSKWNVEESDGSPVTIPEDDPWRAIELYFDYNDQDEFYTSETIRIDEAKEEDHAEV